MSINIFSCFILLFTCPLPCRKDQLAVLYVIQVHPDDQTQPTFTSCYWTDPVYNCEIHHHSTVCRCGLANIQYFGVNFLRLAR